MNNLRNRLTSISTMLKSRILWADVAKAIAIICIIWGHAGSGSQVIFYRNVLYSFHIPVFLIISGFLMRFPKPEEQNIKFFFKFILKNIIFLVVPYLFGVYFSVIFQLRTLYQFFTDHIKQLKP